MDPCTTRKDFPQESYLVLFGLFLVFIPPVIGLECNESLGLESVLIPDHHFHASSWTPGQSDPWYGRLGNQSRKSWCPSTVDANQYIQIDFGPKRHQFTSTSTQGSHNIDAWVTTYTLSYSNDGFNWNAYKEGGSEKTFTANTDRYSVVKHSLLEPFIARFLRFHPKSWNVEICMRVEAFGCCESYQPLGIENGTIPNKNMKSRITESKEYAHFARLNNDKGVRMTAGFKEFLEVGIGESFKVITAVATQGHGQRKEWVTMYSLAYSSDGAEWFDYREQGETKMFDGNTDMHSVVKHVLYHEITAIVIRFNVFTMYVRSSMRVEIYGREVCNSAMGMENKVIPDSRITASSYAGHGKEETKGRLNGPAAWCGVTNLDFMEIDLGKVVKIQKLATQGYPISQHWVTKFAFHYSVDKLFWYLYQSNLITREFDGNTDQNTVVYHKLNRVRLARYVRFQPKTWNNGACMRVELFGCEDCKEPIGFEKNEIPDSSMSATSWYDMGHEPWLGRLYETRGETAWCAKTNDGNQYLQVDLGHVTRIAGVATQGKYMYSWWAIEKPAWVTAYKISSSNDTFNWKFYQENGVSDKVFTGNSASHDVIKHNLSKEMVARYVRFIPTTWETWTCLRIEVYGCKACDSPLGMEFFHIPKESIIDSTGRSLVSNKLYFGMPNAGRLNQNSHKAWMPYEICENTYLQIDLGNERSLVTAVATQGSSIEDKLVFKYTLSFSNDRLDWFDYRDEWETKILEATKSKFIATKNYLKYAIQTRYIRFWIKESVIQRNLRVEIYGSRGHSRLLSLLIPNKVQAYTVTNTSIVAWTKQTRLYDVNPSNTWCGGTEKFYRLDFGAVKEVRVIFIRGHPVGEKWVKKFSLRYSVDGVFYRTFIGYWNTKEFEGNVESVNITKFDVDPRLAARFLDIHPRQWETKPCMLIEVYGDDDCIEPLGMANHLIPNKDIKATSWITIDHNPSQARLHNTYSEGAWCSKVTDAKQYLEIRLSRLHKVTRIATQGRFPLPDCLAGEVWVTQYSVEYSDDGYTWQYYKENGATKVFAGNKDYLNVAVNYFVQPIKAKIVRVRPVQWNQGICMRVELYGCKENFWPVGVENYEIPYSDIRTNDRDNAKFRLNMPFMPTQKHSDSLGRSGKSFLFINMGYIPFKVTGMAVQCRNEGMDCVSKYTVSFSLYDGEWFDFMKDGKQKVFNHDEYDKNDIKVTQFQYEVKARQVRVWVLEHYMNPALRVEFYGYKVDNAPLGLSTGVIPDSAITASSQEQGYEATNARLDNTSSKAWCAATPINNEFLKVDLAKVAVVTQLAIGRLAHGKGRLFKFSMAFSLDGKIWEVYNDDRTGRKVFSHDDIANTAGAFLHVLRFPFRARYVKLYPTEFSDSAPCLTLELYGKEDCQDELGVSDWRVSNHAMTASTSISNNYLPWMGRVGSDIIGGAWCARYNDANQFLQIDLGSSHKIKSVHIQGKERDTDLPNLPKAWVKTFTLSSSTEGFNWTAAKDNGAVKEFTGNTNEFQVKIVTIPEVMIARFVRIHPKTWHNHICMSVEMTGCEECGEPLGMENFKIPHYALQTSTHRGSFPPDRARLNRVIQSNYCTFIFRVNQFLQIDVGPAGKVVSGVAVQGRGTSADMVTKFSFSYSRDGINYVSYLQDGKEKIFQGSPSRYDTMKHRLDYSVLVTSVRIVVKEFKNAQCYRAELYGCDKCKKSCGLGSQRLTSYTLSASSERSGNTVNKAEGSVVNSAWCAVTNGDSAPYLQVTFNAVTAISKILTMGHPVTREYVQIYQLEYSDSGSSWIDYIEDISPSSVSKDITRASAMADGFFHTLQHLLKTKYVRISFAATTGELCLKVVFYGHELCKADLGFEDHLIPDSAFTASSSLSFNHSPAYARLNRHLGYGAWCAKHKTADQYLQVDLQVPHKVKGLALQPKLKSVVSNDNEAWVKEFSLKYSEDGSQWFDYLVGGSPKTFIGITNKQYIAEYDLTPILVGRYVRIVISSWQNRICLRMELYGCKACAEALGMENHKIPDDKLKSSSTSPERGRLSRNSISQWSPSFAEKLIYWQVNFGVQKAVTAVATGGPKGDSKSVLQEYTINYSNDGLSWTNYTENAAVKIFSGTGEGNIVRHYFSQKITCQYMRILPQKWYYHLRVSAEFYGCKP